MSEKREKVVVQVLPALNQGGVERGTIEIAEALQKEGKAVIIRPKRPMKIDRIEKNLRKIRKLYNMGLRDGEKVELDMFGYAKRYFI